MINRQTIGFIIGPLIFVLLQVLPVFPSDSVANMASIASLMVVLWITEALPLAATALLPLVASIAKAIEINPLLLMLPVTLSASMAFMMPVATPPNAIVFASGKLHIMDMVKTGFILNVLAIILITLVCWILGPLVFNIDVPGWAK